MKLLPCPDSLCRCPPKMIEQEVTDMGARVWHIVGTKCGYMGPSGGRGLPGKFRAAEAWNARWIPDEHTRYFNDDGTPVGAQDRTGSAGPSA